MEYMNARKSVPPPHLYRVYSPFATTNFMENILVDLEV